jgi:hypothetical protein
MCILGGIGGSYLSCIGEFVTPDVWTGCCRTFGKTVSVCTVHNLPPGEDAEDGQGGSLVLRGFVVADESPKPAASGCRKNGA